jgi:phosphoribosyl-ATP pyrophosphohydrolase
MSVPESILRRLMEVVRQRKATPSPDSYTASLLAGGAEKIGGKILEEAAELVRAARQSADGPHGVVHEAADLVYHLLVLLAHCNLTLEEVEEELARRFGVSGLEEKARRNPSG